MKITDCLIFPGFLRVGIRIDPRVEIIMLGGKWEGVVISGVHDTDSRVQRRFTSLKQDQANCGFYRHLPTITGWQAQGFTAQAAANRGIEFGIGTWNEPVPDAGNGSLS